MATRLFMNCPFGVTAADEGGIQIEDPKTGQSWPLTNQQARDFVKVITRWRKIAEKNLAETERARRVQISGAQFEA